MIVASSGLMNLAFLGVAVAVSLVGVTILWLVRRKPRSMEAGMRAFSRELEALAPSDARATRPETHVDNVSPAPVHPPRQTPRGRPAAHNRRARRSPAGTPADRDGMPPPGPQE